MTALRKFIKSRRGVIASEFALVVPIMIAIWLGIVELSSAHLVARKVEVAAQSAADIIAQDEFMTVAKLDDIVAAINVILAPYPTTSLGYDISSIVADSGGTNTVDWRRAGGTLAGTAAPNPTIADNLNSTDDSVIVVTVTLVHEPLFLSYILGQFANFTLTETMFARPRLVPIIPL